MEKNKRNLSPESTFVHFDWSRHVIARLQRKTWLLMFCQMCLNVNRILGHCPIWRYFVFLYCPARECGFCCALIIIWHFLNACDVVLVLCASRFVQQSLFPARGLMVSGSTQSGFRSHRRTAGHIMWLHDILSKSLPINIVLLRCLSILPKRINGLHWRPTF